MTCAKACEGGNCPHNCGCIALQWDDKISKKYCVLFQEDVEPKCQ